MATTVCKCGEKLHYTADKIGRVARCRCGRNVALPEFEEEPPPRAPAQQRQEEVYYEEDLEPRASFGFQALIIVGFALMVFVIMAFLVSQSRKPPIPSQQGPSAHEGG